MSRLQIMLSGVAAAILIVVLSLTFYVINPTEQAIVLQFGAPIAVETAPGLHAKIPFVQTVAPIDKRLLDVEATNQDMSSHDGKQLVVDAFAHWRIVDPIRFNHLRTNAVAREHLKTLLAASLRHALADETFSTMISDGWVHVMDDARRSMNRDAQDLGVNIVDVCIRRANLTGSSSEEVYKHMQEEFEHQATEYRAEGTEISQSIRARAEREVTVITAEATREADILRGEGDAEKAKILADAYGQDPDFFAFYRSMQAYQDALPSNTTSMVLSPNSEFFRYFLPSQGLASHASSARGGKH